MSCEQDFGGNFIKNCNHIPKAGVLKEWIGIHDDLDLNATKLTKDAATGKYAVDQLVLKADKSIYRVEGNDKQFKLKDEKAENDFVEGHIHTNTTTFIDKSQAELMKINAMNGGRFFSIVETVDRGGDGLTKFLIGGLESGMKITTNDFDTAENSGVRTVELKTQENALEGTTVLPVLLEDPNTGTGDPTPETTLAALLELEYVPA